MLELSFTDILHNFLFQRYRRNGTSSAATLLVEKINRTSLSEIQGNNCISGSTFKNLRLLFV